MELDLGELVLPSATPSAERVVKDEFGFNVAMNFAFVGVGQGGSRIAEAFHRLGYRRVAAINTTCQDLNDIQLPATSKLDLGQSGAGKDPQIGRAAIEPRGQDVYDLLKRSWGAEIDYAFVCFGAGGGTGAGAYAKVVETVRQYMDDCKLPPNTGVIVALPKDTEGQRPAKNAVGVLSHLVKADYSPLLVIDNQKIREIYRNTPLSQEHATANTSLCQMLHLFNRLAGSDSTHTVFDRADFAALLASKLVSFCVVDVSDWSDPTQITAAMRTQLAGSTLMSVDIGTSDKAGLLTVVSGDAYDKVPASTFEHCVQMLNNMLAKDSTVFQGVYPAKGNATMKLFVMLGNLKWPRQRLEALAKTAGVSLNGELASL